MPELLSLSKIAKNNSLGSFTSHSLHDFSNLASSIPEEADILSQLLPPDVKGRGLEGRAGAQGQAARSPRGELKSERGLHFDPLGGLVGDRSPGFASRGTKEEEEKDGVQHTQGLFLKQLQQQRQHKYDSHGQDPRATGSSPQRSPRVSGSTPPRSPRVSGSTPPRSPRLKPEQARAKLPSGDARSHRDPRTALDPRPVSSSPKPEQPDEGSTRPSTFLSDLQQAIDPVVRVKDSRYRNSLIQISTISTVYFFLCPKRYFSGCFFAIHLFLHTSAVPFSPLQLTCHSTSECIHLHIASLYIWTEHGMLPRARFHSSHEHQLWFWCRDSKQKRKRESARSDQPQCTKQKTAGKADAPSGESQEMIPDVRGSHLFWSHRASHKVSQNDDVHVAFPNHDSSSQQPSYAISRDILQYQHMGHDPHGVESSTKGLGHDESAKARRSSPQQADPYRHSVPDLVQHAQHGSAAHDLNRAAAHLSGRLPDSCDDLAVKANERQVTDEADTGMERKHTVGQPDIDVAN